MASETEDLKFFWNYLQCRSGKKAWVFLVKKTFCHRRVKQGNFWRISFDNLNFKLKFAKCLGSSLDGMKKMLNLITAQVVSRKGTKVCNESKKQFVAIMAKDVLKHNFINTIPIEKKQTIHN